jgi:hypothetical protein
MDLISPISPERSQLDPSVNKIRKGGSSGLKTIYSAKTLTNPTTTSYNVRLLRRLLSISNTKFEDIAK